MAVPTADKLRAYYAFKDNVADGAVSPELTVDSAGVNYIIDATLTEANDYWNGAIIRFEADTTTVALRSTYHHVMDFVAADDKLIFAHDMPATPVNTDTFRIFFGGNWRTSHEIPGLTATGLSNVTGVTIDHAAYMCGAGNGLLEFDVAPTESLRWTAPGDANPGAWVDVSGAGAGTQYELYSEDPDNFLEVTVVFASLPVGDQSDTIALAQPEGIVIPDFEGYEFDGANKTRYHLIPIKNNDGADTMTDLHVWVVPSTDGTDSTTTTTRDATAGALGITSAADWPDRSFWVYNSTRTDCRFVFYRSGNTCYCAAAGAGLRGLAAAAWQIGDSVEVMPEYDIGLDAPAVGQFESPANEITAPGGVAFSSPDDYATGLDIGALAAGGIYGVWTRETIVDEAHARASVAPPLYFRWR